MICSNQSNVRISQFRTKVIQEILSLEPKLTGISRKQQFLAITLLDLILQIRVKQEPETACPPDQMLMPFCLACVRLACKFQTQTNFKIVNLAPLFSFQGDPSYLAQLCLQAESELLLSLDFTMPTETFYTYFEIQEQRVNLSRRQASYFLKLFMVGLEYSSQLTQNPKYGQRIFESILLIRRDDHQIATYLQKIKDWNRNRVNQMGKN